MPTKGFFDVPPETRNIIYSFLVGHECTHKRHTGITDPYKPTNALVRPHALQHRRPVEREVHRERILATEIPQICKQAYVEGTGILYKQARIVLEMWTLGELIHTEAPVLPPDHTCKHFPYLRIDLSKVPKRAFNMSGRLHMLTEADR